MREGEIGAGASSLEVEAVGAAVSFDIDDDSMTEGYFNFLHGEGERGKVKEVDVEDEGMVRGRKTARAACPNSSLLHRQLSTAQTNLRHLQPRDLERTAPQQIGRCRLEV